MFRAAFRDSIASRKPRVDWLSPPRAEWTRPVSPKPVASLQPGETRTEKSSKHAYYLESLQRRVSAGCCHSVHGVLENFSSLPDAARDEECHEHWRERHDHEDGEPKVRRGSDDGDDGVERAIADPGHDAEVFVKRRSVVQIVLRLPQQHSRALKDAYNGGHAFRGQVGPKVSHLHEVEPDH